MSTQPLTKTADDYSMARPMSAAMMRPHLLQRAVTPEDRRLVRMRMEAEALNHQLRHYEAARMSQTIENFGGPGTERSRYVRAIMMNPYSVNPMLPYMGGSGMGPMAIPPGAGVYGGSPSVGDDPGQKPAEMTALEQGMTRTASVSMAAAQEMGRMLAKQANGVYEDYGQPPPAPQYVQAVQRPSRAQAAGKSLASAVGHFGKGLGESAMAAGHGIQAASSAIGRGVHGAASGVRDFMSQEQQGGQRWGLGMPPAAMTNEYGQPIY